MATIRQTRRLRRLASKQGGRTSTEVDRVLAKRGRLEPSHAKEAPPHPVSLLQKRSWRSAQTNVLGRTTALIGVLTLILMTIWILFQGYRIVIGKMRGSMMEFSVGMLRAVLIVSVATTFSLGSTQLSSC